jgi:hypothetical protein
VEEVCEAMLSRSARRLRKYPHLKGHGNACDLFLTQDPPSKEPKDLHVGFGEDNVESLQWRLLRMVSEAPPYLAITWAKAGAKWRVGNAVDYHFPGRMPLAVTHELMSRILRGSLVAMMLSRVEVGPKITDLLDRNVPGKHDVEISLEQMVIPTLKGWEKDSKAATKAARDARKQAGALPAGLVGDEADGEEGLGYYSPGCSEDEASGDEADGGVARATH